MVYERIRTIERPVVGIADPNAISVSMTAGQVGEPSVNKGKHLLDGYSSKNQPDCGSLSGGWGGYVLKDGAMPL